MTIAFQGENGAYSEQAVASTSAPEVKTLPLPQLSGDISGDPRRPCHTWHAGR